MRIVELCLAVTILAVLYRLWRGPTPWDRLLAYNSASNRIVLLLGIVTVTTGDPIYLDVAIVYAALSFVGVVILARFMEQGGGFR